MLHLAVLFLLFGLLLYLLLLISLHCLFRRLLSYLNSIYYSSLLM